MTYVPVVPPRRRRWRRRLRRIPWTGLLWIGGSTGVLIYAARSGVDPWQLPLIGAAYLILLGAAVAPQTARRRP